MDISKVVNVKVRFDDFGIEFDAWRCMTSKGEVLREKSFCKEDRELYYLCLLQSCNLICIQKDGFTLNFAITSGNLQEADGTYEVTFMGNKGTIEIG